LQAALQPQLLLSVSRCKSPKTTKPLKNTRVPFLKQLN